jgi:pimeloyl-ACP methyl ester carboxylesterase
MTRERRRRGWCRAAAAAVAVSAVAVTAREHGEFTAAGLHYRLEGSGQPVVLIHGFHMDLREWDEVAAGLASSRRVLRYDVRGHGRSRIESPLPSTVADLHALLEELAIARAMIVGSSMGSTIALDYALMHPDRVERLVLLSPGIPGVKVAAALDWMTPIIEAVRRGQSSRAAELWWESPLLAGLRARGEAADRYRAVVLENASIWTVATRSPPLEPAAGTRLNEVKAPILAVAGELDRAGAVGVARIIAASVAHGRVELVRGAGHMLTCEKPAQVIRFIMTQP